MRSLKSVVISTLVGFVFSVVRAANAQTCLSASLKPVCAGAEHAVERAAVHQ